LDTTPLKTELAGVPQDQFTVAGLMPIELKTRGVCEQRLQEGLALDELKAREVPTVQMQEIESVIDELYIAFTIGRRPGLRESRQPSLIDAAQFAIDVSGLDVQVRQRRDRAWIFVGPVEPGPSQELNPSIVDTCRHSVSVQLDFVQPLRPGGWLLDRLGKLRADKGRKG
jgi:hypothetical protein